MGILGLTHTPIFRPSDSRPFLSNKWFILQPVRLCAVNICTRPHAVIARKEKASALRIGGVEVLLHLERVTGMSREMQSDRSESKTKLVWIQRTKMNVASFLVVSRSLGLHLLLLPPKVDEQHESKVSLSLMHA